MNFISQKIRILRFLLILIDLLLLLLSCRLAIIIERFFLHGKSWDAYSHESFNFFAFPILFVLWLFFVNIISKNRIYRETSYFKILKDILLVTLLTFITLITVDFILKAQLFYRSTIVISSFLSFFFIASIHSSIKYILTSIRTSGFDVKNILIVGVNDRAKYLVAEFRRHKEYGFNIKYIIDPEDKLYKKETLGFKLNHSINNLYEILRNEPIDEVFIACSINKIKDLNNLIIYIDSLGISLHIVMNSILFDIQSSSLRMIPKATTYYDMPSLTFNSLNANLYSLYIKNFIERIMAFSLIIILSPLFIITALLIKFSSKGNIIFKQSRVGFHGRLFFQYKFRSMVDNAMSLRKSLEDKNEQSGPVFKIKNDPRLTLVGRFIRKFSIDELPQLINVIKGDMNLIGPRPPIPDEVKEYKPQQMRRLSMKPGITGLWQVSGRNSIKDFNDWVSLDLEYIDNWSLLLDLKIALKTIYVVISGSGR